jgi:uncharacterized membrane protein YeaQ/YmgE (transglycosylase-associated protein family)
MPTRSRQFRQSAARKFATLTPLYRESAAGSILDHHPKEATMLHLIWSVVVGFIVGLIARALLPGVDHMGFWMTSVIGIGGSLLGGLIGMVVKRPAAGAMFHPAGFLLSIVGAVVLLYCMRYVHIG